VCRGVRARGALPDTQASGETRAALSGRGEMPEISSRRKCPSRSWCPWTA
jgi:hypothetical protein